MSLRNVGVFFALIHNNNQLRNDYLKPHLENLANVTNLKFDIKRLDISMQPKVIGHSVSLTIFRSFLYEKLGRDWSRYRNVKPQFFLKTIFNFFRINTKKIFSSDFKRIWARNSFIETIVTDKHIRAWSAFIDTDCEFLVCFEDDAVFHNNSIERLSALIDILVSQGLNNFSYVDLAGGCDINDLQISQLETFKQGGFTHYSKPVTNTACVYLLSRSLVSEFLNQLTRRPWLRLIGIDWMMNKLFMLIEKSDSKVLCMHSSPPIFYHGSTTGAYKDWRI